MHKSATCLLIALAILTLTAKSAYAYIDPGTGGLFYQIIILVIGAVAGYLAFFKRFIKGIFGKKKDLDDESE